MFSSITSKINARSLALLLTLTSCAKERFADKPPGLDDCASSNDCVITNEDTCCGPSTCDESVRAETIARRDKRHAMCAVKECEPGRISPCTTSGATFIAECRDTHCVVKKAPGLVGSWRVVAFHRGDSVSRDPRSTFRISFSGDQTTWSGETTSEVRTTAGVKPVTTTWTVTGRVSRAGDVLAFTWPEKTFEGTAGEILNAWTTRKDDTSQVRLEFGNPLVFLNRLDVDTSLELAPDTESATARPP